MAFVASEAAVETLAERIARGEVDDLIEELPRDLRPARERSTRGSDGLGRTMSLRRIQTLAAERAGTTPDQAREYAGAVLATIHNAVSGKEFAISVAEDLADGERGASAAGP